MRKFDSQKKGIRMKRLFIALLTTATIYPMKAPDQQLLQALIYSFNYQKMFDEVTQAINQGADINARDSKGRTPLIQAMDQIPAHLKENRYKICTVLSAAHKANPNIQDDDGMTALMHAAKKGYIKECEFLITCGADIHAKGPNEETALMLAASANQAEICQFLLKHGANIHQTDKWKQTALHAARNNASICTLLLQAGANLNQQNHFGETALGSAAYSNYQDAAATLIEKGAYIVVDRPGHGKFSYVNRAAERGHIGFCRMLLNAQAVRNDCIRTLLLCISRKAQEETLICTECRKCKKNRPMLEFYRQRDTLLTPYLKDMYVPIRVLLEVKNHEGKNARDLLEHYWLNAFLAKNYQIVAPESDPVPSAGTTSGGTCTIA